MRRSAVDVDVHYAGQVWRLAEGTDVAEVRKEITTIARASRGAEGFVELKIEGGGTVCCLISPGVPLAVVEVPRTASGRTFGI